MKNPELINREELLKEIKKVYDDHYAKAYDQTIHDMYNAIVRRVRRAPNCTEKCEQKAEKCKYWNDGVCMGQKGAPACSPDGPYCPMKGKHNG